MTKGIIYYTDNRCEERLATIVRNRLKVICKDFEIISVSHYPIDFGKNIVVNMPRHPISIFRQILIGLEHSTTDLVYLVEHDVLYHPSHFDPTPKHQNRFYYNKNRWAVDATTGRAIFHHARCMSHMVAGREILLEHFTDILALIDKVGYNQKRFGFSPGVHRISGIRRHGVRDYSSEYPNIDVKHATNLTPSEWEEGAFPKQASVGWQEADEVPGWGKTKDRFDDFLNEIGNG